jgi:TfoX/Sxy family transcriptional regulator of competence genes
MMQYDQTRVEFLTPLVHEVAPEAETRKMFGHETWFLNGHMLAGANTDGIYVHLAPEAVEDALACEPYGTPFRPDGKRIMKEYVQIIDPAAGDAAFVSGYLKKGATYLRAKPPKRKHKRRQTRG